MFSKSIFVFAIAIILFPLQLQGQLPDSDNTDHLKFEKETPQSLLNTPALVFPVDGVWLNSMLVIFEWDSEKLSSVKRNPSVHSLSSTVEYLLEVSRDLSFAKPIIVHKTTGTSAYKVLYEGRYYWRVKAFDPAGTDTVSSLPDSFGIDITYPSEPTPISPVDRSFIKSRTPEFIWSTATDNLSGVDHYELQYADHSNLNYGAISVIVKDTTYTPSSLSDTTYYWRVRAVDEANNKGCWCTRWSFTITTAGCPDIPTPLFPSGFINDVTPTFIWTKEGGPGVRYSLQYALDESFQQGLVTIYNIFDTVYTVTTPLLDTTYYWRVEAIDPFDCESGWSTYLSFTIDTTLPSIPTLVSPPDHSVMCYNMPNFVWTHTAGVGGDYTLQYAFDSTFTQGVVTISNISDTTYTVLNALPDSIYHWHVEAIDYTGNHSGYQAHPFIFAIHTKLPDIPVLISPEDSSVINDETPTFIWDSVTGLGMAYTLEYTPDNTFASNVVRVFNITDTTYTIPGALALSDSTYYWRIEAVDQGGCHSGYQAHPFMFTIDTELPDIPILIAPECVSLLNDNTPTFVWSSTAGPSGYYTLQYALNSSFTQGVVTISNISDTNYTPVDALEDNTYYWRVEAIDQAGNHSGYQSYLCMFTIDTGAPEIPILIQPCGSVSINDRTPKFVWSSTAGPNGSYTLQYSGNQNFYPWATITIENLTETSYTLPDTLALPDGNYYWHVEAIDEADNHSGYQLDPCTFTIDTWPPDRPVIIAPTCDTTLNSNTVQFIWSSVSGCATYVLQYALNSTFTLGRVTISNITDTTYTRTIPDGMYYWRVEAVDYAGNHSGYTAPCKLVIDTQGPCPPTLISPPDYSAMCGNTPKFVWTPTAGSGGYYTLEWALDSLFTQSVTTIESIPYNQNYYQITSPLADTTWYWHVEAIDHVGNHSGYQIHPFRFTVDTKMPAKPVLILPPNNSITNDNVPTFVWSSVDDAACYNLQYAKNSVFTLDVVKITNLTDTVYTVQNILADGDYYWRVEAVDRAGCHSGYQDIYHVFKFTIDTEAPCPPTLVTPCGVVINDNTPKFVWSTTLVPGEGTYTLQYARDSMFTQNVMTIAGIVSNTYTIPASQALTDGTWYWHVEAIDQAGNRSGYSFWCAFHIFTELPEIPTLIVPVDGTCIADDTPTFIWSSTAGPGGSYILEYALNINFTLGVVTVFVTDTTYTVPSSLPYNTYYWRVDAVNQSGSHSGYQPHPFTFTIGVPEIPILIEPKDDTSIVDDTPTFVWSSTAGPGGSYTLQYALDSTFTQDVVTISNITNTTYTVPSALAYNTYYWHVDAVSQAGCHSGYQPHPFKFTIGIVVCEPTELTISKYDTDKLLLEWTPTCCTYNVYRDTIPCDTLKTPIATNLTDTFYIDSTSGVVGNPDINYFYYVTGTCNGVESEPSNQVGEFDFRLITSTPTSYNDISIPLHKAGLDSASDVAADIGPNCSSISRWLADRQEVEQLQVWPVRLGNNFPVFDGYPYRVYMRKDTIWTLTGDVPDRCAVSFNLITSDPTSYNWIAIPLCHVAIFDSASDVADDIGPNCSSISRWLADRQEVEQLQVWPVRLGNNFPVFDGYPYRVYMRGSATWPSCSKGVLASSYTNEANYGKVTGLNFFVSKGHHLICGYLRDSNNETPEDVYFKAYITSRPEEILTQASPACRYSNGIWAVQIANFPSPWKAGDILHVDFSNKASSEVGSVEVALAWSDYDQAEDVILQEKPEDSIENGIPEKFAISQNNPNPFSSGTEIDYTLSKGSHVSLKIYNIAGQCVKTLVDEYRQAGYHKIKWDGKSDDGQEVVNGIYIYNIIAGEYKNTKRMLIIR